MTDIKNKALYVRCEKKDYNVSVSRLPLGTCIINKFEQAKAYNKFNVDMIYPEDFCMLDEGDKTFLNEHASIVTEDQPIAVLGTEDEIWLITEKRLLSVYETLNGKYINPDDLSIDWTEVRTKTSGLQPITWCLHIPVDESFDVVNPYGTKLTCNDGLCSHGDGDYIVCYGNENGPDLAHIWVVNGNVFPKTYNII